MRYSRLMLLLLVFLGRPVFADQEGLSRTSWGRFGWWETHIGAQNRTYVDGLLAYTVTLDGLAGVIQCLEGEQWAGAPPYLTEPLKGNSRLWGIKLHGTEAESAILTLARQWRFAPDTDNQGLAQGWQQPDFDDSAWGTMMVGPLADAQYEATGPFEKEKGAGWGAASSTTGGGKQGTWENQGLEYDGVAWYRLPAIIPASWRAEKVYFHCYGIDDEDQTFVNGTKIGETTTAANPNAYTAERIYEIPADIIRWGEKNTFAVRVYDDHGGGGIAGSAVELVRGRHTLEYQSVAPKQAGEAPIYIKQLNWVAKWIELPDYEMTYSLASALVRVRPKGDALCLDFDVPVRHAAYMTAKGVQVVSAEGGPFYAPRDGPLTQNWVLLWHGATVGHNEDLPVLLVLHGRPDRIAVNGPTVTLRGRKPSFDFGPPFGLRRFSGSDTEMWTRGLPPDVLAACQFWSRAALAYPVANQECYDVDQDTERVTITEKYEYEIAQDDWGTEPLKIAPVPPVLACLLDAGYPGKMLTARTDPGFVTYYGPFAATVDSDTAKFELPIPVEDSLAALATPGAEAQMDELTRGIVNLFQRWSGRSWADMGSDDESLAQDEPIAEAMDFDTARERALVGNYHVIGVPANHQPGEPLPSPSRSPVNMAFRVPPFVLLMDERARPGVIAGIRRMAVNLARSFEDETFLSGAWRVEVEPTCHKPMTYSPYYRYENVKHRANGEAPYDFGCVGPMMAYGFYEAGLWTGNWSTVRRHWHKLLQVSDSLWRNHDWASAACDNKDSRPNSSVDITWDHSAALEALARCARAIGDTETYEFLCYLRARVALVTVGQEAIQLYLQPMLLWPDHFFIGHVGEPYPPYWMGVKPEGGIAMDWDIPYPEGAVNQVPWRFNSASVPPITSPLRWMALTMPREAHWFLDRLDRYCPHAYDGERWDTYAPGDRRGAKPPYFPSIQHEVGINHLALSYFLGDTAQSAEQRLDRLARAPALAPWNVEVATTTMGRGGIQQLLATAGCPMWASTWEPRVIWEGRYDPTTGTAAMVVQPGDKPLRFTGTARQSPMSVSINGTALPQRSTLKAARAESGWYYDPARHTIHVYSLEKQQITLDISFRPAANPPAALPRMVPETPSNKMGENLLVNGGFDTLLTNLRDSPFIGAPTGPYLYVNRWLPAGTYWGGGAFANRYLEAVGAPARTTGLTLRMYAAPEVDLAQNVAAGPGTYRLMAHMQRGAEPWDAGLAQLQVTLKALAVQRGAIKELSSESRVVLPETLHSGQWAAVALEVTAPEETNAMQVGLAFEPMAGEGDVGKQFPIYVDDVELIRTK